MKIELYPVIEFMGDIFPTNASLTDKYRVLWFELTDQMMKRYSSKYENIQENFNSINLIRAIVFI